MNGFVESPRTDEKINVEFWEMISTINNNSFFKKYFE